VAACRQKRRVRFTTATGLINELVEAQHQHMLGRALKRWSRYDVAAIDEVGYVPIAEVGAEYSPLFDSDDHALTIDTGSLSGFCMSSVMRCRRDVMVRLLEMECAASSPSIPFETES
jgi:hypothetical protein